MKSLKLSYRNTCSLIKQTCFLFAVLAFCNNGYSQVYTATSSIDTAKIKIGEPVRLKVNVRYPAVYNNDRNHTVEWPALSDTITKQVEIIEQSKIDTSLSYDKKTTLLTRTFTITSFDSGYIVVPPLRFNKAGDTLHYFETQPLLLEVSTIPVDTTQPIKDIKPPLDAPFTLKEAMPYIIGGLVLLAIIIGVWYYLKKRGKVSAPVEAPKIPKVPLHITILNKLDDLNNRKLWQAGKTKEYYSELSDILREYLEGRFRVPALEQTTDEILLSLRTSMISANDTAALRQVLVLSDLVKFAKEKPIAPENELSMANAVSFVKNTIEKENEIKKEAAV